jgi:hypothetical protein
MSECRIKTLPWPEWVKSLGLFSDEEKPCRVKNDRHSMSLRMPEATKRTPLGVATA